MVKVVKGGVPKVAFNEMLEYLENKVILPTEHWADIPGKAHTKGFMVTGALKEDLLTDYLKAIIKNKKEGLPYKEFADKFDDIAAKHGWQYKGKPEFRAKVIYQTNTSMAYSAGREKQMQENKELRPYAEFVGNIRPNHIKHNGVHHLDSAFWDYYTPPIDWMCKCKKRSVSRAGIEEYGLKVEDMMTEDDIPRETKTIKVNGQPKTVTLPKDVGYGFDHNPGKAAFGNFMPKEAFDLAKQGLQNKNEWKTLNKGDWQSYGRPEQLPIKPSIVKIGEPIKKGLSEAEKNRQKVALTKKAFGFDDDIGVIPTATGNIVVDAKVLGEHLADDRIPYLPLIREVLEDPQEVWQAFEENIITGRVEIRQRYIRVVQLDKKRNLLFVAQANKGQMTGWTLMARSGNKIAPWREGRLLYSE